MRIIQDANCLADTTVRNFPESRHRSARVHKKLVKRFNGEFRKEPAIFKFGGCFVMHPSLYAEFKRQCDAQKRGNGVKGFSWSVGEFGTITPGLFNGLGNS